MTWECVEGLAPQHIPQVKSVLLSLSVEHGGPWLSYSRLDPKFAGSNPAGVDGFFSERKILNMTSFGREVKPWVPCRRFTARERSSSRN